MTVGIPGAGIGGLFYLLGAFWMPVREGFLALRGVKRRGRWRLVLGQLALAGAILSALWCVGWLLGIVLLPDPAVASNLGTSAMQRALAEQRNVVRLGTMFGTVTLLGLVLFSVQVLRFVVKPVAPIAEAENE